MVEGTTNTVAFFQVAYVLTELLDDADGFVT
jgi:hypothetical protein